MKTIEKERLENKLANALAEMELYEFIMSSFNLILNPEYWGKRNGVAALDENSIRLVVLKALKEEFGDELSKANTETETNLKKACNYMPGLFEVVKLRLLLFYIPEDDVKRIVYLLTSKEEPKIFGGLRSLRLNPHQAEVLMPVAEKIGEVIYELSIDYSENAVKRYLERVSDDKLKTIFSSLDSGDDRFIKIGLDEIGLNEAQIKYFCKSGIDPVISLVSKELAKRDNAGLIEEFNEACRSLDDANARLQKAGFEHTEIQEMLKCTNAYVQYVKCKKALTPEMLAIA